MSAAHLRSNWYSDGLRSIGSLFLTAADRLDTRSPDDDPAEPWPELLSPHDRVMELRNRVHYY